MSDRGTVAELFELAIAAERAAQELYLGLAARFGHHQDVADFWRMYAGAEDGHARWLERIREKSPPGQLSELADPSVLEDARKFLRFSAQGALNGIRNLEDAYQLANDLENSEINVVFEFMITNFTSDEQARSFLRSQLRDHIAMLMTRFPTRFSHPAGRRSIKGLE